MHNINDEGWSHVYPWPSNRDPSAIPEDLSPGDLIMSDLLVRPEERDRSRSNGHDDVIMAYVWEFGDGQSFMLHHPDPVATHMVGDWYRVQRRPSDEEILRELRELVEDSQELEGV